MSEATKSSNGVSTRSPINWARRLASLTPKQRELAELRLREQGVDLSTIEILPRSSGDAELPLSFAQQRLWFLHQLEPHSVAYNISGAMQLDGPLDTAALQAAFVELMWRHEALRTTFDNRRGEPVQVIHPAMDLWQPVVDLSGIAEARRVGLSRRLVTIHTQRPFDLSTGPLVRIALIRLSSHQHCLTQSIHHIVSDAWSMEIIRREVLALYHDITTSSSQTAPRSLPPVRLQYGDFAIWQRKWLQGKMLEKQLSYWKEQLGDGVPALELQTDRQRGADASLRGAECSLSLAAGTGDALGRMAREEKTTQFVVFCALFEALLWRVSGKTEFTIGSTIAGRNRPEIEEIVGFFINTRVLRADFSGQPTLRQAVRRVRKVVLEAEANQDLPFEKLVEELAPQRSLQRAPLFQVTFSLVQVGTVRTGETLEGLGQSALTVSTFGSETREVPFDLTMRVEPRLQGLVVALQYRVELFERTRMRRLLGEYGRLLDAASADPDRSLGTISLLSAAQHQQILVEWSGAQRDRSNAGGGCTVHGLIAEQVRKTPTAIAVRCGDQTLTYGQMEARSNRLARYLRRLGVGSDDLVGLAMERSLDLVVAVVAVLKAGAGYLPLDPSYPADRLAFMVEDAEMPVLVSSGDLASELPKTEALLLRVDVDGAAIDAESSEPLTVPCSGESLCYAIFTSGSTGRPKGTLVTHRAVHNRMLWLQESYGLTAEDRVLQKTPISFDVSVWEIFWPLTCGASIVLARPDGHMDAAYLLDLLVEAGITTLHFVPSMLRIFLAQPGLERLVSRGKVRRVVASGEALTFDLQQTFFERLGRSIPLHNMYGPSEAARATYYRVDPDERHSIVPIGRPVANDRIYLADSALRSVAIGVPGELLIGGIGVARGYHRRPGLTAKKFLPDPFAAEPGVRLYRTGDLTRYLPDGAIEFLGRIDHQVKVRGMRVELGEIDAALESHPAVRDAVVVVREVAAGDQRLVAYLVAHEEAPSAPKLRRYLAERLPDYMLPTSFMVLEAMPLTPSGKVDRRALPEPEAVRPELEGAYVAPSSSLEESLAGIFADVLGVDRVGVHDGFFDLGGHSLLATQVVSRVRDDLGIEVPLRSLFERPTVVGWAELIEGSQGGERAAEIPALVAVDRVPGRGMALSFAQQRLWFLDRLLPNNPLYNMFTGFRLEGDVELPILDRTFQEIVRRHEVLRTVFAEDGEVPVQVLLPEPFRLPLPLIDLSALGRSKQDAQLGRLANREALRPFDLAAGPLLRVHAVRLAERSWALLINIHHINSDGWSTGVLYRELITLYRAFAAGEPSPLDPLEIQYADFAVWQRGWLQGEALDSQVAYWAKQLAAVPPALQLPADHRRRDLERFAGGMDSFQLDPDLSEGLNRYCREQGVTLFMVALAVYDVLLYRYSGQKDILIGSGIANRTYKGLEELIGFFINTLVMRTRIHPHDSFSALLGQVREMALDAYSHQDLPFERLIDELKIERSLVSNPLCQVGLLVQNFPVRFDSQNLPGIQLGPLGTGGVDTGGANFDLTIFLREAGDWIAGGIEYNADLFEATTIRRLAGHYRNLLAAAIEEPSRSLLDLPILQPAERQQLLHEWSGRDVALAGSDLCLHRAVNLWAGERPEAIALADDAGFHLSYRRLVEESRLLADRLWHSGVRPGSRVGVCLPRSPRMMVAFLATVRLGAAYVPMAPSLPLQRLSFILRDARPEVLLVEGAEPEELAPVAGELQADLIDLRLPFGAAANDGVEIPAVADVEVSPRTLAYVIYTSGSTGKPKGVEVSHAAAINYALWMIHRFEISPGDRFLQQISANFDPSVAEFWVPLLAGARSVVSLPAHEKDPRLLAEEIERQRVTITMTVPSMVRVLLDEPSFVATRSLTRLFSGGEVLPVDLKERFLATVGATLTNLYGPTEATVACTFLTCPPGDHPSTVAIGRPIDNSKVLLLDQKLNLSAPGAIGELCIGGAGLAQGYLAHPRQTAESFIPDPYPEAGHVGARIYRSGDLARLRSDGLLEFSGRKDLQVKVRGFRIEPGEVEAAIEAHPEVADVVVVVHQQAAGDQRLVAYLVAASDAPVGGPSASDLRAFLGLTLPAYMVPSSFVLLEELPLSTSGKVDRRALPEPEEVGGEREIVYVAPRSSFEKQLAAIWEGVLEVERVGVNDNFFDLGGHSLLATRVISRLREVVAAEVPVRTLFEAQTLGGWARAVTDLMAGEAILRLPPLVARPREPGQKLLLSFAQQRLWFLNRLEPENSSYHLSSPMRIEGPLSLATLHRALRLIVERHEVLRTQFGTVDSIPVQIPLANFRQPMPVIDLSGLSSDSGEEVATRLTGIELERPFDLRWVPLLRTVVLRLEPATHALLLNMHHIVSDGWSLGIFYQELLALYEATARDEPSRLPPLPIQYIDFALWQREFLEGEVLDGQLAYWEQQLRGAPALLELPLDRPRRPIQGNAGHFASVILTPTMIERVRGYSREHGVTTFVTLICAFVTLLARSTRAQDIPIGVPVAGRNRTEVENLIGFFVSTLVLRADASGNPSFAQLVSRVAKVNAQLNSNQDVPFDRLVDRLAPERSLGHSPLFQVSFSHQPSPGSKVSPKSTIRIRPQYGRHMVSMFDLSLSFDEQEDSVIGSFTANAALFDRSTLIRLARNYQRLLAAALDTPAKEIQALPIFSAIESHQVLCEWGSPAATEQLPPVHQTIAAIAAHHPERIALLAETPAGAALAVSYGELMGRASGWAERLQGLGVGPEVTVGLALERTPALIETMLGVLLAGGCYLPLDPAYPEERLRFMVADAKPAVLLTHSKLAKRFTPVLEGGGCRLVRIDGPSLAPVAGAGTAVGRPAAADADNPAYLIYTSGSTGKPKGVMVTHRGLANYTAAAAQAYKLGSEDRLLQFSSVSFDASAEEIFTTLSAGAALFLRPEAMAAGPSVFFSSVERWRLTVLGLPTAYWHELAASTVALPASLRLTILGGEAALPRRVEEWCRRAPTGSRLVNTYGPTETTICATHWQVDCAEVARDMSPLGELGDVPIGRAVDGVWLRVLNRAGRSVPIGVPGELAIGGAGVARGYLGQPALTARRFVPDAGSLGGQQQGGQRLYRSGDLVRTLHDGTLQFLGRVDLQVKVRGFRIEPGEIEAALADHPQVREVVVGIDEPSRGDRRLVAWFVAKKEGVAEGTAESAAPRLSAGDLRAFLSERLPAHMIPAFFIELEELPKNAAGKLDRHSLPALEAGRLAGGDEYVPPSSALERTIAEIWCEALDVERVGTGDNFFDLGGHSLLLIRVQERLQEVLQQEVSVLDLFRYPTVAGLAAHLQPGEEEEAGLFARRARERLAAVEYTAGARIAIVGMAARFPMARTADQFWSNLRDGLECLTFFTPEELIEAGVPEKLVRRPDFIASHGWYEGPGQFDARLFNLSPREAEILDPQQRIFMECAWEALEHAGHAAESFPGRIGLFAGSGLNHYVENFFANPRAVQDLSRLQLTLANDKDFLATRVSYKLDLRGPSINVQTACSTSLVATHLACRALALGECEMALAGGVTIGTFQKGGYLYQPGGIASSDGHNRAFDAKADGSAGGDGVGIVVLKRLDDALADGDVIYSVIRGSALNNDGSNKVGFTAPSIEGQAEVIAAAQVAGGVTADEVSYVETHGTATALGDPIEIAALREVFGKEGGRKSCAIGAVKSNIGHVDSAAGAAGLIKTALALHHKQIPPSLLFETPNPKIDFDNSPLFVNTELREWTVAEGKPRIAGVSSFGLGGTNAHIVLQEAPPPEPGGDSRSWQIVPLSAMSQEALSAVKERLVAHLHQHPELDLADVAFTLQQGRKRLPYRQVVVAEDTADLLTVLEKGGPGRLLVAQQERSDRPVTWLLPGLGDHYPGMAGELYATEPTFRAAVDRCCERLEPLLGEDLRQRLFTAGEASTAEVPSAAPGQIDLRRMLGRGGAAKAETVEEEGPLDRTRWAQPAVFVIEYALAQLWLEWGPPPEAMIGYSLGEYTVACLAGVLELDEALELVARRATMIDALPPGRMLAVPMTEEEILPLLGDDLSLAALNGPRVSVVAGSEGAIAALEAQLMARDVLSRRLRTTHAFHSHLMQPIARRFGEVASRFPMRAPKIPYLSNVTGRWMTATELRDPEYWVRHLCDTVRFADGMGELLSNEERVLVEVGPGQALSTAAMQHPDRQSNTVSIASLRDARQGGSDVQFLLASLGRLWLAGGAVDWRGFTGDETRRRLPLPTYPFEHQRYWIDGQSGQPAFDGQRPAGMKIPDVEDWFYLPHWRPAPLPPVPRWPTEGASSRWLVLSDGDPVSEGLIAGLEEAGQQIERLDVADFGQPEDHLAGLESLLIAARDADRLPVRILHGWTLGGGEEFEELQRRGLYSVSALVAMLGRLGIAEEMELTILSRGLNEVLPGDEPRPGLSTLHGALLVVPQEYRNLRLRAIDIDGAPMDEGATSLLFDRLMAELCAPVQRSVAFRGGRRFVAGYEPVPLAGEEPRGEQSESDAELESEAPSRRLLRRGGVYLMAGGFGYVGAIVCRYLARRFAAKLVLLGRSALPAREEWDGLLAGEQTDAGLRRRIELVRELESLGSEVLAVSADVADPVAMERALRTTEEQFGTLHGVFYLAAAMSDEVMKMAADQVTPAACRPIFRAKVEGLHVLDQVLADRPLDFCLLFSSMASVLGGLGFAAYAAANAYVDAFAARQQRRGLHHWLCANWDGWEVTEASKPAPGMATSVAQYSMTPSESGEAIHRLLGLYGVAQVVVSTGDLDERLRRWVELKSQERGAEEGDTAAASLYARPDLTTPYVEPDSEMEKVIAGLWQELLGIGQVGLHDDFFQLGGDSLLATQLASRMRAALKMEVPLGLFFSAPTVFQMAVALQQSESTEADLSEIEQALAEIGELSEEDILGQLAQSDVESLVEESEE